MWIFILASALSSFPTNIPTTSNFDKLLPNFETFAVKLTGIFIGYSLTAPNTVVPFNITGSFIEPTLSELLILTLRSFTTNIEAVLLSTICTDISSSLSFIGITAFINVFPFDLIISGMHLNSSPTKILTLSFSFKLS